MFRYNIYTAFVVSSAAHLRDKEKQKKKKNTLAMYEKSDFLKNISIIKLQWIEKNATTKTQTIDSFLTFIQCRELKLQSYSLYH